MQSGMVLMESNKTMRNNITIIKDKIKLVLFAVVILSLSILLAVIVGKLSLSESWQYFLYGCIIYISGVVYLVLTFISKSKRTKYMYMMLLLIVGAVVGLSYVVFNNGWIPMPNNLSGYLVLSMIIAPATFFVLDLCTKKCKK